MVSLCVQRCSIVHGLARRRSADLKRNRLALPIENIATLLFSAHTVICRFFCSFSLLVVVVWNGGNGGNGYSLWHLSLNCSNGHWSIGPSNSDSQTFDNFPQIGWDPNPLLKYSVHVNDSKVTLRILRPNSVINFCSSSLIILASKSKKWKKS